MSKRRSLVWIDIGMMFFIAAYLAIVLFTERDLIAAVMLAYLVSLTIWAVVAEEAVMRDKRLETREHAEAQALGSDATVPS